MNNKYQKENSKSPLLSQKSFPEILKALRIEKDLSQAELGIALHLSQNQISKYERGIDLPSGSILFAMAKIFGVSAESLLGKSESPSKERDFVIEKDLSYLDLLSKCKALTEENILLKAKLAKIEDLSKI